MTRPKPQVITRGAGGVGTPPARCTIGLLTWNAGKDGLTAVASIFAQLEPCFELIWIDNASTDYTVERLRDRFPRLTPPHINTRNVGFCSGHNQALFVCRTPYYLALNQDAELDADYILRICDWMDSQPALALASGLILMPDKVRIYSAGMAWPRSRFAFELGMGMPLKEDLLRRRLVPAVDGSAMVLRVEACRRVSFPHREIFPKSFFAYGEEVDLALRLARAGYRCGVDGTAVATHRGRGSGGFKKASIRARFFLNHWLVTLRNDDWDTIVRELPWILRGELQFWLREYLKYPAALVIALWRLLFMWRGARRFYDLFENAFGPTDDRMRAVKKLSSTELMLIKKP